MHPDQLETQAKDVSASILTNLQTSTLLKTQLEQQVEVAGQSIQNFSHLLEAMVQSVKNSNQTWNKPNWLADHRSLKAMNSWVAPTASSWFERRLLC